MRASSPTSCFDDTESVSTLFTTATSVAPSRSSSKMSGFDAAMSRSQSQSLLLQPSTASVILDSDRLSQSSTDFVDKEDHQRYRAHHQQHYANPHLRSNLYPVELAHGRALSSPKSFSRTELVHKRSHLQQPRSSKRPQAVIETNCMLGTVEAAWEDSSCVDEPINGVCDDQDDHNRSEDEETEGLHEGSGTLLEQLDRVPLPSTSNYEVEALRRQVEQLQLALLQKDRQQQRYLEQSSLTSGQTVKRSTSRPSSSSSSSRPKPPPNVPLPKRPSDLHISTATHVPSAIDTIHERARRSSASRKALVQAQVEQVQSHDIDSFDLSELDQVLYGHHVREAFPASSSRQHCAGLTRGHESRQAAPAKSDALSAHATSSPAHHLSHERSFQHHPYSDPLDAGLPVPSVEKVHSSSIQATETDKMEALTRKVEALEKFLQLSRSSAAPPSCTPRLMSSNSIVSSTSYEPRTPTSISSDHPARPSTSSSLMKSTYGANWPPIEDGHLAKHQNQQYRETNPGVAPSPFSVLLPPVSTDEERRFYQHQRNNSCSVSSCSTGFRFNETQGVPAINVGSTSSSTSVDLPTTGKSARTRFVSSVLKLGGQNKPQNLSNRDTSDGSFQASAGDADTDLERVSWSRKRREKVSVPKTKPKVKQGPGRGRVVITKPT